MKKYQLDIEKMQTIQDIQVVLYLLKLSMDEVVYEKASDLVKGYFTEVKDQS